MSHLPIDPASPERQQKIMQQMYLLMGKQVQSYHKHRRMGSNTSVPAELARELLESIEYTVGQAGGVSAHGNIEEELKLGQEILDGKVRRANSMLELVNGTAPHWQTQCRWEALRYLRHYLDGYDHRHLAQKGPEALFYPVLISPPEGIRGIDSCLFYLNILWIENQIMAPFPEDVLDRLWDRLPADTLNQCEHLLINGIGKILIGAGPDSLIFGQEDRMAVMTALANATEDDLKRSAKILCQRTDLKNEDARMYAEAVIPRMTLWTGGHIPPESAACLFL